MEEGRWKKEVGRFKIAKGSPLLIILLAAIVTYWPIAFCVYTFKWDMLDVVFPFRYFGGECIRNGIFPLWNPYQLTGVPVYADLQYPLFSPEMWITGLTAGYSIYTLHFLFIFYLVLAGYGMYRLTLFFNDHRMFALLTGITYMLSGFFVGHGQALFSIIGAAFLPWVVLYMIKNCLKPGLTSTLKLAAFIFLMLTTGYQFISIMTAYLLLAILIYYVAFHRKTLAILFRLFKYNGLLLILVLLLCLVLVIPVIQVSDYNERIASGLSYSKSLIASFTWQSLISLVTPFATVKYPEFFGTDISMRNMHTGLIMLLVFVSGLMRKKTGIQWLILSFGLVCLLASFGSVLPVHKMMFRFLPFIHMLRMPAYFNLFTSFAIILIAGLHLPDIIQNNGNRRSLKGLTILSIILMVPLLIFSILHIQPSFPDLHMMIHQTKEYVQSLNSHEHIVIQAPVQLVFLFCLLVFLLVDKFRPYLGKAIFILVCVEMVLAVNLNSYFTVYSTVRPQYIQQFMKNQPSGFPVPENTAVMDNSDKNLMHDPLWRNMGILTKKLSYDGFSSFILKPFNYVDDSLPALRDVLIENPPVYISGSIKRISGLRERDVRFNREDLYVSDQVFNSIPVNLKRNTAHDTLTIHSFSPVHCTVSYTLDTAAVITYLQADYPGWEISIDGEKVQLFNSNFMYLSAFVPAGEHQVTFTYENRPVLISFIISYAVFMIILVGLVFRCCRLKFF
jgi:hypothetical protein